jgi:hypothetical protein
MGKEILLARMVLSKHGGDDENPESEFQINFEI